MMVKTTLADDEWVDLEEDWRAAPTEVAVDALRTRVLAQTRRMRVWFILEALLTITAVIAMVLAARAARTWDAWLVITGLATFTLVIWRHTVRNRRGTWRAAGESLEDYQALDILRRERRHAAATFTRRLCLAAMVPLLGLTWYRWQGHQPGGSWLPVAVCVGAMAYLLGWAIAARRIEAGGK